MRILRASNAKSVLEGNLVPFKRKPYKSSLIPGSLIFGMGWGLAGACPGTVLVMLGEGKLGALFTISGIVLGVFIYGFRMTRMEMKRSLDETAA